MKKVLIFSTAPFEKIKLFIENFKEEDSQFFIVIKKDLKEKLKEIDVLCEGIFYECKFINLKTSCFYKLLFKLSKNNYDTIFVFLNEYSIKRYFNILFLCLFLDFKEITLIYPDFNTLTKRKNQFLKWWFYIVVDFFTFLIFKTFLLRR